MTLRWNDLVTGRDGDSPTSDEVLTLATRGRTVEFILGAGFDPRALVGLRRLLSLSAGSDTRVVRLSLPGSTADQRTMELAARNESDLAALIAETSTAMTTLPFPTVEDPRSAGIRLARELVEPTRPKAHAVIVDISGLPSSIHFPVVGAFIEASTSGQFMGELVIVVCENAAVDDGIVEEGVSEAGPIGGFKDGLDLDSQADETRIWAPIIGAGREAALLAVHQRLGPREICPVLPFPARNPRRSDDLVLEYHDVLFGQFGVEERNVIYADERSPVDLYRSLSRLHGRYGEALQPLGTSRLVISSHSSKLLSVGVLLAAYEHGLPVVNAIPTTYAVRQDLDLPDALAANSLTAAWICGEPYRA